MIKTEDNNFFNMHKKYIKLIILNKITHVQKMTHMHITNTKC